MGPRRRGAYVGCRAAGAGGWKGGGALVVKVLQHLLHELVGEALRDALGDGGGDGGGRSSQKHFSVVVEW